MTYNVFSGTLNPAQSINLLNSAAREIFECHSHCAYIEARDSYIGVI